MMMRRLIYTFVAGLLAAAPLDLAHAQEASGAVMELDTNLPEAYVYVDSLYMGLAGQGRFDVPVGRRRIRLIAPEVESWSIRPVESVVDVPAGDTLHLSLFFPYLYQIESVPFDAQVFLEQPEQRLALGLTPLLYESEEPLRGMLLISKEGYEPERFSPGESVWNHHRVVLSVEDAIADAYWKPDRPSRRWVEYVAGGVALVAGVAAVRFKAKADRRFDRYSQSGDPSLRSGFERYDRYAAVSLGVMQAGIGVLAIRLIID